MDFRARKINREVVLQDVELTNTNPSNILISSQPINHAFTSLCSSHYLKGAKSLLPTITRDERLSQDHLLRGVIIILSSMIQEGLFTCNEPTSKLLEAFFESSCVKHEVLNEFLALLTGNGFYLESKDEFYSNWKRNNMSYTTVEILEQLAIMSVVLLDYITCVNDLKSSTDQYQSDGQVDMVLNQTLNSLTSAVKKGPGPFDFIIPRVLDIFIHKNLIDEALQFLLDYKNLNKDNLNAYVYIFKFLVEYKKDFSDKQNRKLSKRCLKNIVKLAPCSNIILEILDFRQVGPSYGCRVLMELVDYTTNKDNPEVWKRLNDYLEACNTEELNATLNNYNSKYSSYWPCYHWKKDQSPSEPELSQWKRKVKKILSQKPSNVDDQQQDQMKIKKEPNQPID